MLYATKTSQNVCPHANPYVQHTFEIASLTIKKKLVIPFLIELKTFQCPFIYDKGKIFFIISKYIKFISMPKYIKFSRIAKYIKFTCIAKYTNFIFIAN